MNKSVSISKTLVLVGLVGLFTFGTGAAYALTDAQLRVCKNKFSESPAATTGPERNFGGGSTECFLIGGRVTTSNSNNKLCRIAARCFYRRSDNLPLGVKNSAVEVKPRRAKRVRNCDGTLTVGQC